MGNRDRFNIRTDIGIQDTRIPRLLAYGPVPPPYGGQAVSFGYLVDGLRNSTEWRIDVVNVSLKGWQPAQYTVGRAVCTLWFLLITIARLISVDLFYLTIGQSLIAFLRDATLVWVASLLRKKVVAHLDGGAFHELYVGRWPLIRWAVRATVRRITRFQVLSEAIKNRCLIIPGMTERIEVVPDGTILPVDVPPKTLPIEGPIRVLYLSNLMFEKGYTDLIEAATILRARWPDIPVHLDFAGEFVLQKLYFPSVDAAQEDFWSRIEEGGLTEVISFHGLVTGNKKEQLLRESQLFVLPTYYRYEGTPRSIREALSYGMPVIATEWSGLPDMVTDEENGFLVPIRSPYAIAEAITKSVSSNSTYRRLSQGALARSLRGLSLEDHLTCMKKSFALALSSRR